MILKGDNILINIFSKEDINDKYISWLNDKEVVKYSGQRLIKHTHKTCLEYFLKMKEDNNKFLKIIYLNNNEFIGTMSYMFNYNCVDVGILIGNKNFWGKKIGLEAWNISIKYLLSLNHIDKITAGCMSTNLAMKNIFIKTKMNFSHSKKILNNKSKLLEKFIYYEIIK